MFKIDTTPTLNGEQLTSEQGPITVRDLDSDYESHFDNFFVVDSPLLTSLKKKLSKFKLGEFFSTKASSNALINSEVNMGCEDFKTSLNSVAGITCSNF